MLFSSTAAKLLSSALFVLHLTALSHVQIESFSLKRSHFCACACFCSAHLFHLFPLQWWIACSRTGSEVHAVGVRTGTLLAPKSFAPSWNRSLSLLVSKCTPFDEQLFLCWLTQSTALGTLGHEVRSGQAAADEAERKRRKKEKSKRCCCICICICPNDCPPSRQMFLRR